MPELIGIPMSRQISVAKAASTVEAFLFSRKVLRKKNNEKNICYNYIESNLSQANKI